jgi:hypothetical protein
LLLLYACWQPWQGNGVPHLLLILFCCLLTAPPLVLLLPLR